jgi:organic hydroperoxide reductase OsmC/OhrA
MEKEKDLTTTIEQVGDYEFLVKFSQKEGNTLLMDEPQPLGKGKGPNAWELLAAAVGNCLSASLLFCLRRAHIEPRNIKTTVKTVLTRNEKGRTRIGSLSVTINPEFAEYALGGVGRCLDLFEEFCIVTQSVRKGIDVQVNVVPSVPEPVLTMKAESQRQRPQIPESMLRPELQGRN